MTHELVAEAVAEVPSLRGTSTSKYSRPVLVPTNNVLGNVLALAGKGARDIRLFPHNGTTLVSRLISGEPAPTDNFGPVGTFQPGGLGKAVAELVDLKAPPRQISLRQTPGGYAVSVDYSV